MTGLGKLDVIDESASTKGARTALSHAVPGAVLVVAAALAGLLLAVAGAYGFHRDEMYFIVAGRHPAFGYVDQPPLTPLVSAVSAGLFGVTPFAVRLLPAFVAAAAVVLTADIARRLGAGRQGQVLAALVLAISGWLGAGHLDETTTYDIFFWTLTIWLLVPLFDRVSPTATDRWRWLAVGLVMGIALENKTLAIALPLTVGVSIVVLRRWELLSTPWPWLAALLALVIWAPNVVWQASHGFSQLTMAQHIAADQGGVGGRVKALVELLALAGPLLFPVAIAGLVWLLRDAHARPWRPLGLAIVLQLGLMLVVGGKSYYSAGFLPLMIAAGSIPLERWLERGRGWLRRSAFGLAAIGSGAIAAVLLLPIVPVDSLHATPIPAIYGESVAQVGWPQLVSQVAGVADSLSPAERSSAVILTADYGQYSALTLLGSGLPPTFSGHNSTWDWGRPIDGAGPVILVAWDPTSASLYFSGCRVAATIDNQLDLPTQEQGRPILVCAQPLRLWPSLWPDLRHVD
jgi:4-amino-4-deoxy-L-arabinose transferase-like glycosyltransferase